MNNLMTAAKASFVAVFYANFSGIEVVSLRYLGNFAITNNAVFVLVGSGLIIIF
ncbi:hypothetical protein ACIQXI_17465 [Lysinibacillus sp. NPDC097195]|uniref:hypothetical protein n=1 Tax=Lysinibacillus sp. NPDC097195 TaxID=3364141 RepID=UPI00381E3924